MSIRSVLRQLGFILLILSAAMVVATGLSIYFHLTGDEKETNAALALGTTMLIGAVLGLSLIAVGRRQREFLGRREALLLVAMSWLIGAALAALPFRVWAAIHQYEPGQDQAFTSFVNCYFEAMSGLTTTGATVLTNIPSIPQSLLFWRAFTHWLGGLGIVVLFVAVLPMLGVGGKKLFQIEAPGPEAEGVRPRIQEAARMLWVIYLALTLAEVAALRLAGVGWFDSFCHTFATLATGGFSTHNASIAHYRSLLIDGIIIVFMVMAGINFGIYYKLIKGNWRNALTDPELKAYLVILLVAASIITFCQFHAPSVATDGSTVARSTLAHAAREGVFTAVSIQTTTGFCTADFDVWSFVPKATLLVLMFVGASAGSTGGGIKVVRVVIAVKVLWAELERVFHPQVVRTVRFGKAAVDPDLRLSTIIYVFGILVIFILGTGALMVLESPQHLDITTAASASAATLNNIGPGLSMVGASCNYAWFGKPSKVVMCLLMVLGRLELYAILVLFSPRFWRPE